MRDGHLATMPSWNRWRAVSSGDGGAGVLNSLASRDTDALSGRFHVRNAKVANMSERSDGLAVFANSFRLADRLAPVRPLSVR